MVGLGLIVAVGGVVDHAKADCDDVAGGDAGNMTGGTAMGMVMVGVAGEYENKG